MPDEPKLDARSLVGAGFRALVHQPYVWLVAIGVLCILATSSIDTRSNDPSAIVGVLVIIVISAYSSIGVTLAAAEEGPNKSPEVWVRAAFVRRCLIRSGLAGLFAYFLVLAGLIALIVPGFIIGASMALADIAAILENHRPGDAIRRSIDISKPARKPIGIVFGLLIIFPSTAFQVATYFLGVELGWLLAAIQCFNYLLASAAHIALTKAFLQLGGKNLARSEPAPTPERL